MIAFILDAAYWAVLAAGALTWARWLGRFARWAVTTATR